jgi:hypothetical protein
MGTDPTSEGQATTFLLVPGAGGSAGYWYRAVPLLEAARHRAVPVELPAGDDEAGLDADHWNRSVSA